MPILSRAEVGLYHLRIVIGLGACAKNRMSPAAGSRLVSLPPLFLILASNVAAQSARSVNPVLNKDFPDPSVARAANGTFYAYATMGNGHHLQVASSPNLVNWTYLGEAMPRPPNWTSGGCFWAPDVQRHGDTFFMYYAASTKTGADGRRMEESKKNHSNTRPKSR